MFYDYDGDYNYGSDDDYYDCCDYFGDYLCGYYYGNFVSYFDDHFYDYFCGYVCVRHYDYDYT